MTNLFLAPATRSGPAYRHFEKTVLKDTARNLIEEHSRIDTNSDRLWGLTSTMEGSWETIDQGDWILFYTQPNHYEYATQVVGKEHNPRLGEVVREDILEDKNDANKDWTFLVYVNNPVSVSITGESISRMLDYKNDYPVRFIRVTQERLDLLREKYNSVDDFIGDIENENPSQGTY